MSASEEKTTNGVDGRQRLLLEAMRLFADRGFDAVTVRDITQAAGVSVGLVNHHYGSKDELRKAVDEHVIEQFEEVLFSDDIDPGDPLGWVEDWIDKHSDEWEISVGYMRRGLIDGSEWGNTLFQRFFSIARTTVDRLDAAGSLRPDVDRLWLPFLIVYLELGTLLLAPHVEAVLGRSGFDRDLWQRRYTAYIDLINRGASPPE